MPRSAATSTARAGAAAAARTGLGLDAAAARRPGVAPGAGCCDPRHRRAALPRVDPARVAAIGFCFGGLCVLDLARTGADIRGAASFHGLFTAAAQPRRAADQGQSDRLPRLGRRLGAARPGGRAGRGADRGRRRLADPRLWRRGPRLHPSRRRRTATFRSTRLPRRGRGAASNPSSANASPDSDARRGRRPGERHRGGAGRPERRTQQAQPPKKFGSSARPRTMVHSQVSWKLDWTAWIR